MQHTQSTRVPWRRRRAARQAHQVDRSPRVGTRRDRVLTETECGGEGWLRGPTAKHSNGCTDTSRTAEGGGGTEVRYTKAGKGGNSWSCRRTSRTQSTSKPRSGAATTRSNLECWQKRRRRVCPAAAGSRARYHQNRHTQWSVTRSDCSWTTSQCTCPTMQTTRSARWSSWATPTQT